MSKITYKSLEYICILMIKFSSNDKVFLKNLGEEGIFEGIKPQKEIKHKCFIYGE